MGLDIDHQLLSELLDRWEDSRERGVELTALELCADVPGLAPILAERITSLRSVDRWFEETSRDYPADSIEASSERGDSASFVDPKLTLRSDTIYEDVFHYASGGLGEIYSAVDGKLNRRVAIKLLAKDRCHIPTAINAFRMEAEIASRLSHPAMVPVYAVGNTDDGRPFYVMKFVRGKSLDQAIDSWHPRNEDLRCPDAKAQLDQWLRRFMLACRGVGYAHDRGIIHRDLKLAHILLGRFDETLVVDWGLAKPIGRSGRFKTDQEETLVPKNLQPTKSFGDGTASVAGTPAFMSPEQIWGGQSLDPSTDIYSLGASLYKLVTGKLPFFADEYYELRRKIVAGDCPPPSQQKAGLDRRLELIIGKAMQVQRPERYETMQDLADDLQRYLADKEVAVDQPGARWASDRPRKRFWSRRSTKGADKRIGK